MKNFKYPLRVGKKQKRTILDANGVEVGIFQTGSEEIAQEFCDFLNMKNIMSRVEIIGPQGREIVTRGSYTFDIQDECRTLKIFRNE